MRTLIFIYQFKRGMKTKDTNFSDLGISIVSSDLVK